jgi:starvation-inducible DNA-binding protein
MPTTVLDVKPTVEHPEIDLEQRKRLVANLLGVLADSHVLMVKTQGYHWNVVGPMFVSLHQLTEQQYQDLFGAIDDVAERIRALGYPAPGSMADMIAHSALSEESGHPTFKEKVQTLIRDHETVVRRVRDAVAAAEDLRDAATADILIQRLRFHEKAIWMLRAIVTG